MGDETHNVADKAVAEPITETTDEAATEQPPTAHAVAAPDPVNLDEPDEAKQSGSEKASADESVSEDVEEQQEDIEQEDDDTEQADAVEETTAEEELIEEDKPIEMDWYILKVQSNRERSITEALRRKIAVEGLEDYFGEVVVPTEKVTEFKGGKKKVVERKLYPGYIVVHMCINDDTWFAVRETAGIGDFTGSGGKPTPMLPHEVARIIQKEEEEQVDAPKLNIRFKVEDRVKIKEGTFEGFEGDVSTIDTTSGRVTVMINIFGRSTPVELEYWQIEAV